MITKSKLCSRCKKDKVIFKNKTIDGVKKQFCQTCWNITNRELIKEKKSKIRQVKKERITEKKLDTIFSKLVRNIYPQYCHSSKVPITPETSQCAHLIGRNNRCTRFDLRNCYPTTPAENMYNQLHVIQLAKRLEDYYDINIEDFNNEAKQNTCKLTSFERKEMYDIFKEALDKCINIRKSNATDIESALQFLRYSVINKTKKIF